MVEQLYTHDGSYLFKAFGHPFVLQAGLKLSAGVVMGDDNTSRTVCDGVTEDLSEVNQRLVECAHGDNAFLNAFVTLFLARSFCMARRLALLLYTVVTVNDFCLASLVFFSTGEPLAGEVGDWVSGCTLTARTAGSLNETVDPSSSDWTINESINTYI